MFEHNSGSDGNQPQGKSLTSGLSWDSWKEGKINWDTEGTLLEGPPRSCLCNASKLREKEMQCVLLELDCFARKRFSCKPCSDPGQGKVPGHKKSWKLFPCGLVPSISLVIPHHRRTFSLLYDCLPCLCPVAPWSTPLFLLDLISDHISIFKLRTFWPTTIEKWSQWSFSLVKWALVGL